MEELLKKMELYAEANRVPILNSGGKAVLTAIAQQKQAVRILEIGTAIGYSALLLAQNSAADVQITTLELDDGRAGLARSFIEESPFAKNIDIIVGDAAAQLPLLRGCYDLVFIDAAKGQYVDYFYKVLPLLNQGGVIAADNVLFRGYVLGDSPVPRRYKTIVTRLRNYIDIVTHHPEFITKVYEDGDGLAVSYHRG